MLIEPFDYGLDIILTNDKTIDVGQISCIEIERTGTKVDICSNFNAVDNVRHLGRSTVQA